MEEKKQNNSCHNADGSFSWRRLFAKVFGPVRRFLTKYLDQSADRLPEADTVREIQEGIEFKGSTIWILICATFIASLGLNTNSTAVIIGAMLISPLMGPIMGIGLGLGIYNFELIKKSFRNLAVATLFSVITSTVYFLISPLNDARSELLARTAPSIYDVLIAFFGGMAGIVALSSKLKGNVLPGVAIATALMPPLCTSGFGLATGNIYYFLGAFYLYCINLVFIAIATTIGVKLMHFSHKQFVDPLRKVKVYRIVYGILFLTMIPSFFITYNMVRDNYFQARASHFVNTEFVFPRTQVLKRSAEISHGKRIINVSVVGEELSAEAIATLEGKMAQFGLEGTKLVIQQGFSRNQEVNMDELNSTMFDKIYKDNQQKIESQERQIAVLGQQVENYSRYDSIGKVIAPELKVLFPAVRDMGVSDLVVNTIDPETYSNVTLAVVRFDKMPDEFTRQRFEKWLKARLGVKNLRLLIE